MKNCRTCKSSLPVTQFYYGKNKDNRCKSCLAEKARKYRATVKGRTSSQKTHLKKYGLTLEEYHQLFSEQGARCKLCGSNKGDVRSRLHIDHCHNTGKVRGLLCSQCNFAVGYYEKYKNLPIAQIIKFEWYLNE